MPGLYRAQEQREGKYGDGASARLAGGYDLPFLTILALTKPRLLSAKGLNRERSEIIAARESRHGNALAPMTN